jgi:hypothetical protein
MPSRNPVAKAAVLHHIGRKLSMIKPKWRNPGPRPLSYTRPRWIHADRQLAKAAVVHNHREEVKEDQAVAEAKVDRPVAMSAVARLANTNKPEVEATVGHYRHEEV